MANVNFRKLELTGFSKQEMIDQAPFNLTLPGADCTQALRNYKKARVGQAWTDADMKAFMAEQLEKKTRNSAGNGCYVVIDSPVADTRERPYKFEDVKREGATDYVSVYQVINEETNAVLAETTPKRVKKVNEEGVEREVWTGNTKADAKELVRSLYDGGLKANVRVERAKKPFGTNPVAFRAKYTPSKNTKVGRILVWGIEA